MSTTDLDADKENWKPPIRNRSLLSLMFDEAAEKLSVQAGCCCVPPVLLSCDVFLICAFDRSEEEPHNVSYKVYPQHLFSNQAVSGLMTVCRSNNLERLGGPPVSNRMCQRVSECKRLETNRH
eukprot:733054-Rhodomonas_salina.3